MYSIGSISMPIYIYIHACRWMLHLQSCFLQWALQDFYTDMASDADYVSSRRRELRALHKMKADDKRVACRYSSGLTHTYVCIVYVYNFCTGMQHASM